MTGELADIFEQPITPQKAIHGIVVVVLSCVAVGGGLWAANGTGTIYALYFLAAVVAVPLVTVIAGRRTQRRKRTVQIAILVAAALGSFTVSYLTAHRPPASIFRSCFLELPPPGVTEMKGRVQYFDGMTYVLQFVATDTAFDTILKSRGGLAPSNDYADLPGEDPAEGAKLWWQRNMASMGRIADPSFADPPDVKDWKGYELPAAQKSRLESIEELNVFRDQATGRTWVVYCLGG